MTFAKRVFTVAGIWGLVVLTPLYFSFDLVGRVAHGLEPFRGAKRRLGLDVLPAAGVDVSQHEPADADAFHPFQILGDAVLRDVAHRPVPPGARLGGVGRIAEARLERVARSLGMGGAGENQAGN